eukprot:snap_masked-scaffold_8-processed-gene-8.34-mRNA-1 protein AED:1.00 eAED:1.00 QI:0/0/0/0/1/1/2/0/331
MCELNLPLLSTNNSENCDSNLFEFYKPFSTGIQAVYIIQNIISLIAFLVIFIKYTKLKNVAFSTVFGRKSGPEKIIVKATTLTLIYNLIGLSGSLFYGINGLSLKQALDSQYGRIDFVIWYIAVHFLYNVHYQFIPVVYQLVGFAQQLSSAQKKYHIILSLMPLYGIITSSIFFYLVFYVKINIHQALIYMLLTYFVNSNVLGYGILSVMNDLLDKIKRLQSFYRKKSSSASIKRLYSRLLFYKKVTLFFIVLIYTNTTIIANPNLTKYRVYGKFILPNKTKCLSLGDSKDAPATLPDSSEASNSKLMLIQNKLSSQLSKKYRSRDSLASV